jgi:hypothetical protein
VSNASRKALIWLVGFMGFSSKSLAETPHLSKPSQAPESLQEFGTLKGEYAVASIARNSAGEFEVTFVSTKPLEKLNELKIVSQNIHLGLQVNQVLKLAAEYRGKSQRSVKLSQVLLYIPSGSSQVPVWMLASDLPQQGLRASRLLEMHAPATDYQVL